MARPLSASPRKARSPSHSLPTEPNYTNGYSRSYKSESLSMSSASSSSSSTNSSTSSINRINGQLKEGECDDDDDETRAVRTCDKYGFFTTGVKDHPQAPEIQLPYEVIRRREAKWVHMLENWDKYMRKKWKKIRDRCRKGIPHSMRGKAWLFLCGGHLLMRRNPKKFAELDSQKGNEQINEEIRKDLHRQFPSHEMFSKRNGYGQTDLFRVLKAFSILRPDIGYCQGQAPLASILLMHQPAEHAFWSLIAICEHYLPGYFSEGLEAVKIHSYMLSSLLKKYYPSASKILKKHKVDPLLYMTEWFMCLFSRTLPWTSVLRIWDMFLCEGVKIIFKAAIFLTGSVVADGGEKKCSDMFQTLSVLRHIPVEYMREDVLIDRILRLELKDRDLHREHTYCSMKRKREKKKEDESKKKST